MAVKGRLPPKKVENRWNVRKVVSGNWLYRAGDCWNQWTFKTGFTALNCTCLLFLAFVQLARSFAFAWHTDTKSGQCHCHCLRWETPFAIHFCALLTIFFFFCVEFPVEAGREDRGAFEPREYYETETLDAGNATYEDSFEYFSDTEQVCNQVKWFIILQQVLWVNVWTWCRYKMER